jgi:hypothetical protein
MKRKRLRAEPFTVVICQNLSGPEKIPDGIYLELMIRITTDLNSWEHLQR